MRAKLIAGGVGVVLLCLALNMTTVAQSEPTLGPDLIILDGADTVRVEGPQSSAGLGGLLNAVLPRLAIEFANTVREIVPVAPAAPLASALNAVGPRLVTEYANNMREIPAATVPATLAVLLNGIGPRLQFEFANHNRAIVTDYPRALLNDRTPPVITSFGSDGVRILWGTDEFATSVIRIGLKSGTYTQTFTDASFQVNHTLPLPQEVVAAVAAAEAAGIPDAADATYFVRIASTDLSGNQATSREYSASTFLRVYLPMVDK